MLILVQVLEYLRGGGMTCICKCWCRCFLKLHSDAQNYIVHCYDHDITITVLSK